MAHLRIANAPCSWGTLEFADLSGTRIDHHQMLDELVATGYVGTELGDWGFMPTQPSHLADTLRQRHLTLIGAFVPVNLSDMQAAQNARVQADRPCSLGQRAVGEQGLLMEGGLHQLSEIADGF